MSNLKKNLIYRLILSCLISGVIIAFVAFKLIDTQYIKFKKEREEAAYARINYFNERLGSDLNSRALDWSRWDESYEFIQTGSQSFVKENLNLESLNNLNIDEMAYINYDGKIVAKISKTENSTLHSWDKISKNIYVIRRAMSDKLSYFGFDFINNKLYAISYSNISKSDGSGDARGIIVIARALEESDLKKATNYEFKFSNSSLNKKINYDYVKLNFYAKNIEGENEKFGYFLIPIVNSPLDYAKIFLPISMFLLTMLSAYIIFSYLDRYVIRRVASLEEDVRSLTVTGGVGVVHVDGEGDEISALGGKINEFSERIRIMIAEEARLKREAVAAAEAARLAEQAKANFVAITSHEIRTPLAVVMGGIEMLRMLDLSGPAPRMLERLDRGANRLKEVVDDVLDFSKIEHEGVHANNEPLVLEDFLENLVDSYRPLVSSKGLALDFACETRKTAVRTDAFLLQKVLSNLLDNAVKFTTTGSIQISLARLTGDVWRFAVKDTGVGLHKQQIDQIFQPFVQADQSTMRRFGGTGLGLSICSNIVKVLEGEIGCESKPGKGATFWFQLPLQAVPHASEAPDNADEPNRLRALPLATGVNGLNLLVVEDDLLVDEILHQQLQAMGHRVTSVGNGLLALNAAAQRSYDAILMDLHMPLMDGATAARAIRKLKGGRADVIIVSLSADTHIVPRALGDLFDANLTKPWTISELSETLRSLTPKDDERTAPQLRDTESDGTAAPIFSCNVMLQHENAWGRASLARRLMEFAVSLDMAPTEMFRGLEKHGRSRILFEAQQLRETARALGALKLQQVLEHLRSTAPGKERQWIEGQFEPVVADTRTVALALAQPFDVATGN